MAMDTKTLNETIDKLEALKTRAKSAYEVSNIDTKIELLKKKLKKRYDD